MKLGRSTQHLSKHSRSLPTEEHATTTSWPHLLGCQTSAFALETCVDTPRSGDILKKFVVTLRRSFQRSPSFGSHGLDGDIHGTGRGLFGARPLRVFQFCLSLLYCLCRKFFAKWLHTGGFANSETRRFAW